MVPREAMAYSTLVLASDGGGLAYLVGRGARLSPHRRPRRGGVCRTRPRSRLPFL